MKRLQERSQCLSYSNEIWTVLHLRGFAASETTSTLPLFAPPYLHFKGSPRETTLHIYICLTTLNEHVKISGIISIPPVQASDCGRVLWRYTGTVLRVSPRWEAGESCNGRVFKHLVNWVILNGDWGNVKREIGAFWKRNHIYNIFP